MPLRAAAILACLPAAAVLAAATAVHPAPRHEFGPVSVALSGGFQVWSLSALEDALGERGEELAVDGYALGGGDFDLTYAYAGEFQVRLSRAWFARLQVEWTRLRLEERDRRFLQFLGGAERSPVSLSYTTRVHTRPVIAQVGVGRAWAGRSVRLGVSGSWVVAPVRVVDEINVYLETETVSEVRSQGTGMGAELAASLDYFTDVEMTLFLELFGRLGAADVRTEDGVWNGTIVPERRRVDLDGAGIRLGFRWI